MTRTMYDAISATNIPASATLLAGYGDGLYNDFAAERARFPHATIVEIAVFARDNLGVVLDVETGDASASQAPGWVLMRRKAGVDPTVYCNSSTWPAVRAAFTAAGVAQPHYWIAQYDGDPTIPAGAVAKQYLPGATYDRSAVADYWPGVDPAPTPTPTPTPEDDVALTTTDAKTLFNADNIIPAPSGAAAQPDFATNKYYTLTTHQVLQTENSIEANLNTAALLTKVAALQAELDAVKTQLTTFADPTGFAAQVVAQIKAGLSGITLDVAVGS